MRPSVVDTAVVALIGAIGIGLGVNFVEAANQRPRDRVEKARSAIESHFDLLKQYLPDRVFQTGRINEIRTLTSDVFAAQMLFDGVKRFLVYDPGSDRFSYLSDAQLRALQPQVTSSTLGRALNDK